MTLLPPSPTAPPSSVVPTTPAAYSATPAVPASMNPAPSSGFDIWGPLQRRKYLIALFCFIGAILGYLYYVNSPKTYSASTRLMITTQAPPTMVDSEFRFSKNSLDSQASLISSLLVLDEAAKNGKFHQLPIFKDSTHPVSELRQMLRVVPETKETLSIVCTGSHPDDLPQILRQVVKAYQSNVKKNSQAFGQKTMDLIQRLATRLTDEKNVARKELLELKQTLKIQSIDKDGFAINPFNAPLAQLTQGREEIKARLTDVKDRFKMLSENVKVDPETKKPDPNRFGIAAISARDYLKLTPKPFEEEAMGGDRVVRNLTPQLQELQSLRARIYPLETKIGELDLLRADLSTKYGTGHSKINSIDAQIRRYSGNLASLNEQIKNLQDFVDAEVARETRESSTTDEKPRMDLATFRAQEQYEWVKKYELKLLQEESQLSAKLERLNGRIEIMSADSARAAKDLLKLNSLQEEINKKEGEVKVMVEKLGEMDILNNNYIMTSVQVLDEPSRGAKVAPSLPKSLALGTMLAFLLGLGLAVLVDQSELAFRNPTEIFERLQVPVVGRIPRINTRAIDPKLGHASLVSAHKPSATASESFRDVRTALFFRANMDGVKTILFTSPSPGDGKSTTISNMAISIAQAGKKVVLVDADFRRPRVHQYFGQEMNPGLMDVLNGEMSLKDAIQKAELQEHLYLLPAGGRPRNPGELVTSEAFRNLIEALREKFDYVLIDSPPVLPVSDPATIASIVDGVYLVTRIRKGVKLTAQKAKETLDRVGANWMGVIVNGLDENPHYSEYGYQYGSYSYYGGMYGRYYDSSNKVYRDKLGANS